MIKNYFKIISVLLLAMCFTGCFNYTDINKRAIDISIGVDEKDGLLEFAGEIEELDVGATRAHIGDVYKYSSLGQYFEGSRLDYDTKLNAPDFSSAVRVIAFSKKYAEEKGIESYINRLYYLTEFKSSALVTISMQPTKELFNGNVKNDTSIGYAIDNTIQTLNEEGTTFYKTVQDIKSDIEFKNIGFLIPCIIKKDNSIEYLGLAAMKDSKMVGMIDKKECSGFLLILSKRPSVTILLPHPNYEKNIISTKNTLTKRSIKTTYENNKVNVYIDLNINSQISYLYDIKSIDKDDMKNLETYISLEIQKQAQKAIEMSQKKFKCDVFGFAKYFSADNQKKYKNMDWEKEYPKIHFHVNVKSTIINTNLLDLNKKK